MGTIEEDLARLAGYFDRMSKAVIKCLSEVSLGSEVGVDVGRQGEGNHLLWRCKLVLAIDTDVEVPE